MTTLHSAVFAELDIHVLHDILRLRVDVFVVEQRCPYAELDGRDPDPTTWHLWVADQGSQTVVGYLRLLTEPDGGRRIGRVCVDSRHRSRGLAADLVREALRLARAETSDAAVVLDAQTYLAPWYERRGFAVDGAEFVEDGIAHVPMRLRRP